MFEKEKKQTQLFPTQPPLSAQADPVRRRGPPSSSSLLIYLPGRSRASGPPSSLRERLLSLLQAGSAAVITATPASLPLPFQGNNAGHLIFRNHLYSFLPFLPFLLSIAPVMAGGHQRHFRRC
jgi:hypothetical protein